MSGISIRRRTSPIILFSAVVLTTILGLLWTGNSTLESRIITLRYFLFVLTGLAAFLTPYLLFPDKNSPLIQLGNLGKKSLAYYIFSKLGSYCWPVYFLIAVILLGDLTNFSNGLHYKLKALISSWCLFSSVVIISAVRYVKSGPASQFWKESQKGKRIRQRVADYLKYPLDPGSIPSLINTLMILLIGSGTIIFAVYAGERIHPIAELTVFILLLFYAGYTIRKFSVGMVRDFYSSNSFFREFFGVTMKGEEAIESRKVDQLWWVPHFIRVHVWQFIVQIDRIVPAGRIVAAGHFVVLFIAYQRPDPQFLVMIWVVFALLHHLFALLTFRQVIAPQWLLRWVAPVHIWIFSRFWIQVRWILPLLLGMNLQYFLFGTPDFTNQAIVMITYMISALFVSALGFAKTFNGAKTY